MQLLKYEMVCQNEDCQKTVIILVDPEEYQTPNVCPFCGDETVESAD